jgi:hypothetical protein
MRIVTVWAMIMVLSACQSGKRVDLDREFAWMEGTWKLADASSEVFEAWHMEDGEWRGESYAAVAGMKVPTEKIRLFAEGREIIFSQRVKDRDDGRPMRFQLSDRSRKSWTFTHTADAFPSAITYTRIGDKGMQVRISGQRDGDPVEIALDYDRQ